MRGGEQRYKTKNYEVERDIRIDKRGRREEQVGGEGGEG